MSPALRAVAALLLPVFALADVPLVRDGKSVATIVVAADAPPATHYAAAELIHHLERATGAKLPLTSTPPASGPRILLGDTPAARAANLHSSALPLETFTLRTLDDRTLLIAGRDTPGDPLDRDTSAGTLFGVYEFLERVLGVRWTWPGDQGTYIPRTATLTAPSLDLTLSPRFTQRHIRPGLTFKPDHPALGFTAAAAKDYAREQTIFLRRHRMGRSTRMSYGHAFTNWWQRFGQDHPEWFQLVNNKRGPTKPTARYAMCVSNPDLHREIVAQWKARGAPDFINVVENDILGQCECAACRAWDGPRPADADKYYSPNFKVHGAPFVSDRYARFAAAVQKLAAAHNPNVTAIGYAYFNYFQAPTSDVRLNDHVLLGYCPSAGWYPRFDDEHAWYKAQWSGWRDTGARLFTRTNYFLDGYCMPFIFAHQFADDFQHQAQRGLVATDFDSLTGHWATQGPNLYLLLRLHTHPDANPDTLLAEYYATFGPAAAAVRAYFNYWETYTTTNRPLIRDVFEDRVAIRWRTWAKAAHRVFPPDVFPEAEKLLARAATLATTPDSAARVAFLRLGLEHAKLCARVSALLTLADPASTPERGAAALAELLAFRRTHERRWFSNLNHLAWVEDLSWKLSAITQQEPEHYP